MNAEFIDEEIVSAITYLTVWLRGTRDTSHQHQEMYRHFLLELEIITRCLSDFCPPDEPPIEVTAQLNETLNYRIGDFIHVVGRCASTGRTEKPSPLYTGQKVQRLQWQFLVSGPKGFAPHWADELGPARILDKDVYR